ncbi:hypothetical protein EYF80_029660 [Liparis tanakae]|uniref:Uncharacterized protein n=1 Tax=Liparis tanakae TaxID=230148 RepID=A0A4Z2H2L6_9TELE|nr:hypothetical protein EYF80_029660 [Liparis tanakae]
MDPEARRARRGAAVRSLPAGSPLCEHPFQLQQFPAHGEEEAIGNRMSIPGRRGQRGLGERIVGYEGISVFLPGAEGREALCPT